jgi:hypothetical protein
MILDNETKIAVLISYTKDELIMLRQHYQEMHEVLRDKIQSLEDKERRYLDLIIEITKKINSRTK